MRAAMLYAPREMRLAEVERPKIGPNDVLIKVRAVGICGTDVSMYEGTYPEHHLPMIIGHEFAGEVVETGNEVKGIENGNCVTAEPSWGCGSCEFCRIGEENLCRNAVHMGRNRAGALADYVAVPSDVIHLLPPGVSCEDGQEIITLACAVRAARRCRIGLGNVAAVLGAGHVGLLLIQVLKTVGVDSVFATDMKKNRLNLAKSLGADLTLDIGEDPDVVKTVLQRTGEGVDYVFEATGVAAALRQALLMVKKGGTVVIVGIHKKDMDRFRIQDFYLKELTMIGVRGGIGGYSTAVRLLASRRIEVKPLITHTTPLEEIQRAFQAFGQEDYIRGIVKP